MNTTITTVCSSSCNERAVEPQQANQKRETFEPVTLGHIRSHGCRDLLVYCGSPIICPDETVIRPTEERNSQPS
jgi:hypothetical protein